MMEPGVFNSLSYLFCVHVCASACMYFCMHVEVRVQCLGVSSLLSPCALEFHLKPSLRLCDDPRRFMVFFFFWAGRGAAAKIL